MADVGLTPTGPQVASAPVIEGSRCGFCSAAENIRSYRLLSITGGVVSVFLACVPCRQSLGLMIQHPGPGI